MKRLLRFGPAQLAPPVASGNYCSAQYWPSPLLPDGDLCAWADYRSGNWSSRLRHAPQATGVDSGLVQCPLCLRK